MSIRYKASDYTKIFKHTALGISINVWLRVLRRHRFNIEFPFLFKGLFITLTALVNFPFQLYERLVYNKKITRTKVPDPVFILGHPRSGTTFLHYIMCADPNLGFCSTADALTPHIMLTSGRYAESILQKFMPSTRPQDNIKAGAKMPKEEEFAMANMSAHSFMHGFFFPSDMPRNFKAAVTFEEEHEKNSKEWKRDFHYLIQKLTLKNKGKRLVLKSPANTGRLKELHELYPEAVFIHIHRDPYEVFQSTRKLYESVLPLLSFHKTNSAFIDNFTLDSYIWMHNKYLNDRNYIPKDRLYELGYSEFVQNPQHHLLNIYNTLSIGDYDAIKNSIASALKEFEDYKKNTHLDLSEEEIKLINSRWDFFFKEYGYQMK